jgi:DNA-directed RNA polymerase subunit H (RpoH/RPB5)
MFDSTVGATTVALPFGGNIKLQKPKVVCKHTALNAENIETVLMQVGVLMQKFPSKIL